MKKKYLLKTAAVIVILLLSALVMAILAHPVKNSRDTEKILPVVTDIQRYVKCEKDVPLEIVMRAGEDVSLGGFELLMVNLSEDSRGTIHILLTQKDGDTLLDQVLSADTIVPGEWFTLAGDVFFTAGSEYVLTLTADESEPYFMALDTDYLDSRLPFTETVYQNGQDVGLGVSLGIDVVTDKEVTFGDIFYYAVPAVIVLTVLAIALVLAGYGRVRAFLASIPVSLWVRRWGNELFLFLLFLTLCLSIYSRAYCEGVYISADSADYMREAVNLAGGHGFSYDGLAGYRSWFANWPILYPVMIAAMIVLTGGADAYLASKLVTMALIALILFLLYAAFRKDAWIYALCLTNLGFLQLAYYTWSEVPFMLFLLLFSLVLAKIIREEQVKARWYVLLGLSGLGSFLTRYVGLYVWIVAGLYLCGLLLDYRKRRERAVCRKMIGLTLTAFVSGLLSVGYFCVNKLMNGMPSGVSRTMWWDDYEKLTNDLIQSLLTEIFNIFSLQVPELIDGYPFDKKVLFLAVVFAGLIWFVRKTCRRRTTESVFLTMAVSYYLIFIVIRYFSSMDSFYFRFFEPATFLACIGLIGLLLPYLRGRKAFSYFAGAAFAVVLISLLSLTDSGELKEGRAYYSDVRAGWERAYAEIPEKSVVIFSDLDFRSSYYRPDVIGGVIDQASTLDSLKEVYYGSDYLCVKKEFAETMLAEGEYDKSISEMLQNGLAEAEDSGIYIVVPLH